MSAKTTQNFWSWGIFILILALIGLQFYTGAIQLDSSLISVMISVILAVSITRWLRTKRSTQIKDERTTAIGGKANSWTLFWSILIGIISYSLTWALSPYYPELKIASLTLLIAVLVVAVLSRLSYYYFYRKMS